MVARRRQRAGMLIGEPESLLWERAGSAFGVADPAPTARSRTHTRGLRAVQDVAAPSLSQARNVWTLSARR